MSVIRPAKELFFKILADLRELIEGFNGLPRLFAQTMALASHVRRTSLLFTVNGSDCSRSCTDVLSKTFLRSLKPTSHQ